MIFTDAYCLLEIWCFLCCLFAQQPWRTLFDRRHFLFLWAVVLYCTYFLFYFVLLGAKWLSLSCLQHFSPHGGHFTLSNSWVVPLYIHSFVAVPFLFLLVASVFLEMLYVLHFAFATFIVLASLLYKPCVDFNVCNCLFVDLWATQILVTLPVMELPFSRYLLLLCYHSYEGKFPRRQSYLFCRRVTVSDFEFQTCNKQCKCFVSLLGTTTKYTSCIYLILLSREMVF